MNEVTNVIHELREFGNVLLDPKDLLVALLRFAIGHTWLLIAI
jgi:hypothetical protein